jgi:hypothetical protein
MPYEPAAVTTRGTNISNRARLIKARIHRGTAIANAAHVALATKRLANLEPVIRVIRADGKVLLREIAAELNKRRIAAARGGKWSAAQVARVLSRIDAL